MSKPIHVSSKKIDRPDNNFHTDIWLLVSSQKVLVGNIQRQPTYIFNNTSHIPLLLISNNPLNKKNLEVF